MLKVGVVKNSKLYVNREDEGFIGTSLRKDEFVEECSDIDDVNVFTQKGDMIVSRAESKKNFIQKIFYLHQYLKRKIPEPYTI